MAATMQLVVTLRKDVPDRETADALYRLVQARLADRPDVTITAHVTNHFEEIPPPPP